MTMKMPNSKKTKTMKMPYLPSELVEEILSRVPAIYLKRLQSTCKRWNALFKDQRFTENHFRKASKESQPLMLKEFRVCSMNIKLNVGPKSLQFNGPLDIKDSHSNSQQVDIMKVFHCDGLLLCTTKDYRVMVCNPCLGETRWIQPNTSYDITSMFALGYENNKSCHSYKILRWYHRQDVFVGFEISEFSSGSWRSLLDNDKIKVAYDGVSLKGNTYWLAYSILLRFDFTTERFERLRLPQSERSGAKCLSVFKEEQLSVLDHCLNGSDVEIWLSSKIDSDAALLWTKSFTVDLRMRNIHLDLVSFFVDELDNVVVCNKDWLGWDSSKVYIIGEDEDYFREFSFVDSTSPFIFTYVPKFGSNPVMKLGDYICKQIGCSSFFIL